MSKTKTELYDYHVDGYRYVRQEKFQDAIELLKQACGCWLHSDKLGKCRYCRFIEASKQSYENYSLEKLRDKENIP